MIRAIYLCWFVILICISGCSKNTEIDNNSVYFGIWDAFEIETKDGIIEINEPIYVDFAFSITISNGFMLFNGALGDQKYTYECINEKIYLYKESVLIYEFTILSFENDTLDIHMLNNGASMKTKLRRRVKFY